MLPKFQEEARKQDRMCRLHRNTHLLASSYSIVRGLSAWLEVRPTKIRASSKSFARRLPGKCGDRKTRTDLLVLYRAWLG